MNFQPAPFRRALVAASVLGFAVLLYAQNVTRFVAEPLGSKVKIAGTSTVHDWTVESAVIGGKMELGFDPANPASLKPGKVTAKVESTIPVRSVKSGKKAMDDVMHEAMKMKDFPKIEYRLTELVLKEVPATAGAPLKFDSKGELTVAGVTNKLDMPVTMERVDKTKLKTVGSTSLKMTSFGIKPPAPKLALGLITTGDDVKITFEWLTVLPDAGK